MSLESDVEDLKARMQWHTGNFWWGLLLGLVCGTLFLGVFGALVQDHQALKRQVQELRHVPQQKVNP